MSSKTCNCLILLVESKYPYCQRCIQTIQHNCSAPMVLMRDYVRQANFTTSPCLICKQNSSHLHSLFVSILFNRTAALGIHLCKTLKLYNYKTRLGGEICLSDINMHNGYKDFLMTFILSFFFPFQVHLLCVFGVFEVCGDVFL